MNLPNKLLKQFLTAALVFGCLTVSCTLDAQSRKKKQEIEIPDDVLLPNVSEPMIDKRIEKFSEWVFAPFSSNIDKESVTLRKELTEEQKSALKQQKKQKRKKKKGEDETVVTQVEDARIVYLNYNEYGNRIIGLRHTVQSPEDMDELEEVTGIRRSWYQDLVKAAEAIGPSVKNLTKARRAGNEETFAEYFKEFKEATKAYKRALNNRKPHIDEKTLESITAKNINRRKKAYLEKVKKEAAEKKAQKAQQTEKKGGEAK